MQYISTRGQSPAVSPSMAVIKGIAEDGGLFIPAEIPSVTLSFVEKLCKLDYVHRAAEVLGLFLTDFSKEELAEYARCAYGKFENPANPAPVTKLSDNEFVMELYHGPTCAFKDFALTILPYLLTGSLKKNNVNSQVLILVATSGDTGKAALAGFSDVPGTNITVFYPEEGVSQVQKLQMITQEGSNVSVFAVKGNFDDAQRGVKQCFTDAALIEKLKQKDIIFSSANSINWGRLAPQIVYYFSAYCDLVNAGEISLGDRLNFCVPTGNFGDILACAYARLCGLPVGKMICASNSNNVLTDFLQTGVYDRRRTFYKTSSPSMDILVSSNIERLLAEISNHNGALVSDLMNKLNAEGEYSLPAEMLNIVSDWFAAGFCDDARTYEVIRNCYAETNWLPDTHTAVALGVLADMRGDLTGKTVAVSTASPFKFAADVNAALDSAAQRPEQADGLQSLAKLSQRTGLPVPAPLCNLDQKTVRFTKSVAKDGLPDLMSQLY